MLQPEARPCWWERWGSIILYELIVFYNFMFIYQYFAGQERSTPYPSEGIHTFRRPATHI